MANGRMDGPLCGASAVSVVLNALPGIDTMAELKVLLVIAQYASGSGGWTAQLSLTALEQLTGMHRETVVAGLKAAIASGRAQRRGVTSMQYRLVP